MILEFLQSLWLGLKLSDSKPRLLCYTYRPPSSEVVWLDLFSDSLDISFNENKETIMFGDFNFDIYESSHGHMQQVIDF